MLTLIFTFLGNLLGGGLRLVPEVLAYFSKKQDQAHEFRMAELSLKGQQRLAEIGAASARDTIDGQALIAAIKAQARPSGVRWIDGLSASVRPVITYWWQGLLTAHKIAWIWIAVAEGGSILASLRGAWTADDQAILASIIGYWFVDRALRHQPIR